MLILAAAIGAGSAIILHRSTDLFGAQTKPVREVKIHEEGGLSPSADLDTLWEMSDVVVVAVSVGSRPDNRVLRFPAPEEPLTLVQTAFRFQVIELFKPRSLDLRSFEVSHAGGRLEKGNEIIRYVNDRFPDFEHGQHYLLFLKRRPDGMYMPVGNSPDGEYRIAGTAAEPRGQSGLAKSLADKGVGLLDELRRRAR